MSPRAPLRVSNKLKFVLAACSRLCKVADLCDTWIVEKMNITDVKLVQDFIYIFYHCFALSIQLLVHFKSAFSWRAYLRLFKVLKPHIFSTYDMIHNLAQDDQKHRKMFKGFTQFFMEKNIFIRLRTVPSALKYRYTAHFSHFSGDWNFCSKSTYF